MRVRSEVSPRLGDLGDRRPVGQRRRPGAPVRTRDGLGDPGRDQPLRVADRMRRALGLSSYAEWDERLEFFLDPKPPDSLLDKIKALPKVTELASVFPKTVRSGACQEVVETGDAVESRDPSGPDLLAPGRGAVHHDASRDHARPGHREDERGHVSHAGVRPAHDRNALAKAQGRRGPGERLRKRRPADGGGGRDRLRSGHGLLRDRSAAAGPLGVSVRRIPARRAAFRSSRGKTVDLLVPAEAEIVLEGYVDPSESGVGRARSATTPGSTRWTTTFPVFHVTAVTRRESADLSHDDRRTPADGGRLHGRGGRAGSFSPSFGRRFRRSWICTCPSRASSTT